MTLERDWLRAEGLGAAGRYRRPIRSWPGFVLRFVRLAGPYWRSTERSRALTLTAALVGLTILQAGVPVALNLWTEGLFDSLAERSLPRFTALLGVLVVIILANVAIVTTHLRVKRRLQVGWRDWLTRAVADGWMRDGRHYQVTFIPGEHDNPDGRIAEDVRITTEYAIDLAHSLFYVALLAGSFAGILWVLSGDLAVPLGGLELHVPGHLVWVALAYSAIGTSVALLLGRPLVRATDLRQTREADFRFGLVHARENALAVALVHGEADERHRFRELFQAMVAAWDRQTRALAQIFVYVSSWSVLTQVFPVLVAAPRYIAGTITLGVLMQTAQAFQQMMTALSWPVDNLAKLADWRASVERVLGLHDALDRLEPQAAGPARGIQLDETDKPDLAFVDVAIANPDGSVAVQPFSAAFRPGERVLLAGDTGAAVQVFKTAAGLWPWGRGRVERPRGARIFFMPPKPYLPIGPLRAALAYPAPAEPYPEAALQAALRRVGLEHLIPRLDVRETWEQALTVGEQQRLGFARLLLHRADWIFVEEAADALDPEGVAAMLRLLADEFPQAAIITIGHDPALAPFHRRRLLLRRTDGGTVLRAEDSH